MGLPFLEYVNELKHTWVCCFGVPYGTAIWQVGDASEQNGTFKIALSTAKKLLIQKKEEIMQKPRIEQCEIIVLLNYAWERSFARTASNKKAIVDRGWFPYNRNLLTLPEICSTMTKAE